MFSLITDSRGREPVFLFHVGSASVGIALAEIGDDVPTLFYTAREPLPFQETLSYERFVDATFQAIEMLLKKATTEGVTEYTKVRGRSPHVKKVGIVLSSTWYISKTLEYRDVREKSFTVTKSLLQHIATTARNAFESEVRAGNYESIGTDSVLLEEALIESALNGYVMHEPLGKVTNDLKVSLIVSLMSSSFSDRLFQTLDRVISGYHVHPHSYGLTFYSIIRDFFPEDKNFLLIDIDGEVTDVALVKDEVLTESLSFPLGKHGVLRLVGKDAGSYEARAKLLEREHVQGVKKAQEEWLTRYHTALKHLGEHAAIPQRVFISANQDVLPWFAKLLTVDMSDSPTMYFKPRYITPLSDTLFLSHVNLQGSAKYDANLTTLLLFFNKAKKGSTTV